MLVRCVSAFCLGGGRDVYEGERLDLEEPNARRLIGLGFVVPMPPAPAPAAMAAGEEETHAASDVFETREPAPENMDPRVARGREE